MKKMMRQGDVLIRRVKSLPKQLKELPRDNGRIVLAYGEATGHAHAITGDMVRFLVNEQTQARYLDVKKQSFLRHEEHGELRLPSGYYEVIRQKVYTPEAIKYVAD